MGLLDQRSLLESAVVANCRMNRERRLTGTNGYGKELGFEVLDWIQNRSSSQNDVIRWVDFCCGTGLALIEAAQVVQGHRSEFNLQIEGVDLAGHFARNPFERTLTLTKSSVEAWRAEGPIDLVTCIHGLHYVGDKLDAIAKMTRCLVDDGLMVANIDLRNFRLSDQRSAGRVIVKQLRDCGLEYDSRTRLLTCRGNTEIHHGLEYVGADDQAGPNYTGQPAVNSHYRMIDR